MKSIERRIERLEGDGGDNDDERYDVAGFMLTKDEIRELLRVVAEKGSRI